ncbi:MAG: DNA recombination protein RmuC [Candidatus Midichloriaceae bacterium]|jgi:DNA recombination protein RmuC
MFLYIAVGFLSLLLITLIVINIISIKENRESIKELRKEISQQNNLFKQLNDFFDKQMQFFHNSLNNSINSGNTNQQNRLDGMQKQLIQIAELNENKIENMRKSMQESLTNIQTDTQKKLEDIKLAVEEKLQSTLDKRLTQSFKLVSDQLELVYKGLGEMQNLATGVGDLQKILSNVKTRGIWGEVQLGNLLKQILTTDQYIENAQVSEESAQRVEYALKLPNNNSDNKNILLPIDAKFPLADYHKLIELYEKGEKSDIQKQLKCLSNAIKKEAKTIKEKYIIPPYTTDFAIMFLPVEGLYAEIIRMPDMIESLQREYRVIITSPTTLVALLNTIQMGFKTLVIEKRSNEIWSLLDTIKYEFSNFVTILSKTKIKLDQASKAIGDAERKGNTIKTKLQNVEKLPL